MLQPEEKHFDPQHPLAASAAKSNLLEIVATTRNNLFLILKTHWKT